MFPAEIFRSTIEKLVTILQRLQVRFHLTGGITSVAYGEPRMTQDIDIVVEPTRLQTCLTDALRDFRAAGFDFTPATIEQAIQSGGMFQLFDSQESLKVDIYPRELIAGELSRSAHFEIFEGLLLPIVSRADIAAAKLVWISKGSHKSRRDLRQLYRTSNAEDQAKIEELAQGLKLEALLQTVLAEPEEIN